MFTGKADTDGLLVTTNTRLVAKSFRRVQDVFCLPTFAPTPSSTPVKRLAAVAIEHDFNILFLDVARAFFRAKLDAELFMKLLGGCGHMP